ncbi:helix-turn-helix domain-containing protein [Falsiporphyromonas endometrii]|uniref:Helix-turn-helix domain-containing protein n=1 Tax=Falsiporphyromonas endometrii TaxID=1387297 RepID=A0ABV9K762_9PORP
MEIKKYSIKEVAKMLDITEKEVQNHIKQSDLIATKIGDKTWVSENNLNNFINGVRWG